MEKATLYTINELATQFYQEELEKSKQAKEYLKQREINEESIQKFKIGYAPVGNKLYDYLVKKGYKDEELEKTNLVIKKENEIVDRYSNRLILPIQDVRDKVFAFGGRTINNNVPKYIKSPENIVYRKGENLYGMNIAKDFCKEELILVEGYIDVISLHQRGIKNVVALLGTAMTDNQVKLIKKYTSNVILAFDNDKAGEQAGIRCIEILQYNGINDVRIMLLNESKDPDEFAKKYDYTKIKECLNTSISAFEYKVKLLKQHLDLENTNDKINFLNKVCNLLEQVDSINKCEAYIEKISAEYGISKTAIQTEVDRLKTAKKI